MRTVLLVAASVVSTILIIAGLTWYLSFGFNTRAPSSVTIDGLSDEVSVEFISSGVTRIRTENSGDVPAGIGFAHAVGSTWNVLLMRQAALGQLSEWFGKSAFPEDRLALRLGLASRAKKQFSTLTEAEQTILVQYADGFNSGIELAEIQSIVPLVLMEIIPEKWEPWHMLAVENLWMWLGTDSGAGMPENPGWAAAVRDSLSIQSTSIQSTSIQSASIQSTWNRWRNSTIAREDEALRTRLHLFGFTDNMALAYTASDQPTLFFRYATGDSGSPMFQPLSISIGPDAFLEGLSVPGTLFLPAGRNRSGAWVTLLQSNATFRVLLDTGQLSRSFERVRDDLGTEEEVEINFYSPAEMVIDIPARFQSDPRLGALILPDSSNALVMNWDGFSGATNVTEWIRVMEGVIPTYSTYSSSGVVKLFETNEFYVIGSATTHTIGDSYIFASNSSTASYVDARLGDAEFFGSSGASLIEVLYDDFATDPITPMGEFIAKTILNDSTRNLQSVPVDVRVAEALTYLRSWDNSYDGSSIGASISEGLVSHFGGQSVDPLSGTEALRALSVVVDTLSSKYGFDMRDWRWELTQNRVVYFPGDGHQDVGSSRRVRKFRNEFPPVAVAGRGHPTTVALGPPATANWRKTSAVWNGSFEPLLSGSFEFGHEEVAYTSFLGRFLSENRSAEIHSLHPEVPESETSILRPDHD